MQISHDLKLGDHGVIRSPLRNGHEDGNGRNPLILTPRDLLDRGIVRELLSSR